MSMFKSKLADWALSERGNLFHKSIKRTMQFRYVLVIPITLLLLPTSNWMDGLYWLMLHGVAKRSSNLSVGRTKPLGRK